MTALVRRDLTRLLWRPRSLVLLAYMGASAWVNASPPVVSAGDALRQLDASLTDAIPAAFGSVWLFIPVQGLVASVLAAALVVEDRENGGTWLTVHRAGGVPRWWRAKLVAALVVVAVVVGASAVLVLLACLARGWAPLVAVSEYARAPQEIGYGRIQGLSPLAQSGLVLVLRIAVVSIIALFGATVGAAVRRPALAYALSVGGLLGYWRLAARALPEEVGLRADLVRQGFWAQHGAGFEVSWWWTPAALVAWGLLALAVATWTIKRVEVTE